jgi:hypothetical protein
MPLITDPLLILKEDFQIYRDASDNMDDVRMNQGIREAQVNEMLQFVGGELYLLMMDDYTEGTDSFSNILYENLWFGIDYTYQNKTVRFHGLKPGIVLYAYARMLDNLQLNVTRAGVNTFVDADVSEATTQAQIATKVKSARSQALVYISQAYKYLTENKSDYPTFASDGNGIVNKKSFQSFKVGAGSDDLGLDINNTTFRR